MRDYDLVIVGGGLVGGSLACALRTSGLRIAIVEKSAPSTPLQPRPIQPSYDERVIALSLGSRRIFTGMGLWPLIAEEAAAIRRVHVSERGGCGFTHLDAADERVESLGEVLPARAIGMAIDQLLSAAPDVDWLRPGRVVSLNLRGECASLEIAQPNGHLTLTTRLVIAADGGDSGLRERLRIPVRDLDYGQQAIISTVTAEQATAAAGTAFERFTDSGPLAMLPMTQGRYSVVWTAHDRDAPGIQGLDDQRFIEHLQRRFGDRLGRLSQPARRVAYPLRLRLAKALTRPRLALLGNAAHTLHPVAGQGFNLGLRDVAELTDLVIEAQSTAADLGAPGLLDSYSRRRRADHLTTAGLTDSLVRLFGAPSPLLRVGRNLGLVGLDLLPPLRHRLARRFMGLEGRQPRLARGLAPVSPAFERWAERRQETRE